MTENTDNVILLSDYSWDRKTRNGGKEFHAEKEFQRLIKHLEFLQENSVNISELSFLFHDIARLIALFCPDRSTPKKDVIDYSIDIEEEWKAFVQSVEFKGYGKEAATATLAILNLWLAVSYGL